MPTVSAAITNQVEIVCANYFASLDLEAIYGRNAPLEVDLGCGDGLFLSAVAAANPDGNFLGIERLAGRVRSACSKIELGRLSNARVLRCDISYAVSKLLPASSVAVFHLMFPDPWPKRRHASRRIVTEQFLISLACALSSGGVIRVVTDEKEYFRQIERVASASPHFIAVQEPEIAAASSTFEKRFRQDGLKIHRLVLRKVSDVT
jgi:tRNA (guanine-N7-)-methyltransferase